MPPPVRSGPILSSWMFSCKYVFLAATHPLHIQKTLGWQVSPNQQKNRLHAPLLFSSPEIGLASLLRRASAQPCPLPALRAPRIASEVPGSPGSRGLSQRVVPHGRAACDCPAALTRGPWWSWLCQGMRSHGKGTCHSRRAGEHPLSQLRQQQLLAAQAAARAARS